MLGDEYLVPSLRKTVREVQAEVPSHAGCYDCPSARLRVKGVEAPLSLCAIGVQRHHVSVGSVLEEDLDWLLFPYARNWIDGEAEVSFQTCQERLGRERRKPEGAVGGRSEQVWEAR